MKKILMLLLPLGLLMGSGSCVVVKHDNGKHKGWYKNRHNPHHPASDNPGNANQKGKGKGKQK